MHGVVAGAALWALAGASSATPGPHGPFLHSSAGALCAATADLHTVGDAAHQAALHVRAYAGDDDSVTVHLSLDGGFPRGTEVTRLPRMVSVTIPAMRMPASRLTLPVERAGLRRILVGQVAQDRDFVRVELELVRGARVQLSYREGQSEIPIRVRLSPRSGATTSKWVALTFDDTPFPSTTSKLLEMLDRYNVPATFFVVGNKAERRPDLIRQAFDAGHSIQNHSYSHTPLTDLSTEQAVRELRMCNDVIDSITGVAPRFFRPPGGHRNGAVGTLVRRAGLRMALWDVNPNDCNVSDPDEIARTVLQQTDPGDIIVLHDGPSPTMDALPKIIEDLRSRGYGFVTVDELVKQAQGHS